MSQGPSILLIDDEAQIRKFLRIALSAQGYRVLEAAQPRSRRARPRPARPRRPAGATRPA
jgi:DNA-binding response OmpR family regulator